MLRLSRTLLFFAFTGAFSGLAAQTPARDPSDRLREVLPADVAERVLAKIAAARARELPAAALEHRALKFAAKGVDAASIEASVNEHVERMQSVKDAIERGRGQGAAGEEIEAGAEAMRKGIDGKAVSEFAKQAPSGRSLEVPLFVIGGLIDRGLPSEEAQRRVLEKLQARATDRELEEMPGRVGTGKPAVTGRELADTKRAAAPGRPPNPGPPAIVPPNPGRDAGTAPGRVKKPTPPPGRP
jgi:hypothetical protein